MKRRKDIPGKRYPTAAEINALPLHFRDYIHDIISRDPQFLVRELNECRLQREQLIAKIELLKQEIEQLKAQDKLPSPLP